MTPSMYIDLIFLAVLATGLAVGWFKGAFRIVAGMAGTVGGYIGARVLTPSLAPQVAAFIDPTLQQWVDDLAARIAGSDILGDSLMGALEGTEILKTLRNYGLEQQLMTALETAGLESAGQLASYVQEMLTGYIASVAPLITFLALFILIKLGIKLLCSFLSLDIPVLSQLNHLAGGLIGLAGGLLTVALVCAGLRHFGGAGELVTLPVLGGSAIGGFFCRLFS